MSDKARKKERHRLKRLKKQQSARRSSSITPLQRLAANGGTLECWVNQAWKEQGIAGISVFGTTADGQHAFAVFLVDLWCVGLKKVFGVAQTTRLGHESQLEYRRKSTTLVPMPADQARLLVSASIRFSRQNGFKLPAEWDKWTKIFGNLGDIDSADLSHFGKDGRLLYVGDEKFLRERLIGGTPQEFFASNKAEFIMKVSGGDLSDCEVVEELDDELEQDEGHPVATDEAPMQ